MPFVHVIAALVAKSFCFRESLKPIGHGVFVRKRTKNFYQLGVFA
jgi:hypothetical protein